MPAVPNRSTSEVELDKWNQALRVSPGYIEFMKKHGLPTDGRVRLSRAQQSELEHTLAAAGVSIPGGMHIDQGGNLNQKNHLVRNVAIGAGMTAAALATAGAAGFGPLAGVMGGGAGAAGGAAGAASAAGGAAPSLGVTAGIAGSALPGTMIPIGATAAGGLTAAGAGAGLAGAAGSSVPSLGVTSGIAGSTLPGTTVPIGATAAGGLTKAAGGASLGGKLMNGLLNPNVLEAAGVGLGAIGATQAANRGTQMDAMMEADKNRMDLARDRRADEDGIIRKTQILNYIKNGGAAPSGPMTSANGKPITQIDFGVRPSSDAAKTMATTLEQQLIERTNNPMTLSDYNSKMEPGKLETATNWLAPLATVGSVLRGGNVYRPPSNAPKV
jgi:hypothetical protein